MLIILRKNKRKEREFRRIILSLCLSLILHLLPLPRVSLPPLSERISKFLGYVPTETSYHHTPSISKILIF